MHALRWWTDQSLGKSALDNVGSVRSSVGRSVGGRPLALTVIFDIGFVTDGRAELVFVTGRSPVDRLVVTITASDIRCLLLSDSLEVIASLVFMLHSHHALVYQSHML
jgi:hypothetical protein